MPVLFKTMFFMRFFTFALVFLMPSLSFSQEVTPEDRAIRSLERNEDRNYISLSVENDNLGGGTDQYYTSGVRLTYFNISSPAPKEFEKLDDYVPTFDVNHTTSTFYSIGQNLYTPQNITLEDNQDNDLPWAAFLYGSIGLLTLEDNHIDEMELTLGIVGPEALGKQAQRLVHKTGGYDDPRGWKNQLDFEPGIILSVQRRWPNAFSHDLGNFMLRAEPNINASLGNIYTYAGTGVMLSFGPYQDQLQDTPPRVRPSLPGSGYFEAPDHGWSWYLFAGADARAVARNIFLDGNAFSDSHSVDKKHFVGDATAGLAFTFKDYRLAYSLNFRTDEFDTQSDNSVFGSVTLSTKF